MAQDQVSVCAIVPSTFHPCLHMSVRLPSRAVTLHFLTLLSSSSTTSSTITSQVTLPFNKPCAQDPQNEEFSGNEPNVIDNLDYSETFAMIFQNESVDVDTEPSYSFDAELDDELIRKTLSSPLFTQEQEEPANLRQTCHSHEECLLPESFFTRTSTGKPCTNQVQICLKNGNQVATWKTRKSGFSLKDKANSCWSQIWDPEARTSSWVW